MVTITWEQIKEHTERNDLKEWLNAERQADKERQLKEDLFGCENRGEEHDTD